MASNFLGLFGKKKDEVLAQQAPPALVPSPTRAENTSSPAPNSASQQSAGRKRVTQRLSLKSMQNAAKNNPDPSKIQLPGAANQPAAELSPVAVDGTVDLPFSFILSAIPEQLLVADHQTLLSAPEARVEIGLPLSHLLAMLPSGKLEFALSDLLEGIPQGFVQPRENIEQYLGTSIVLPLAEVFRRIPPHLLSLRSDQRPVDSSVMSMNDPFSREALEKAQAEAMAKAEAHAALELEQQQLAAALAAVPEEVAPEYAYSAVQEESIPDFDPALLAEAESALAAAEAVKAGVELHNSNELIQPPTTYLQPTEPESVLTPSPMEPELNANQGDWSFPSIPAQAEEVPNPAYQEAVPEMDPALIEWARKMAEEENSNLAAQPEPLAQFESEQPEQSEQLHEEPVSAQPEQESPYEQQIEQQITPPQPIFEPSSFATLKAEDSSIFDALNAPTRPIPKPLTQPKPPEVKGFASFPTMPVVEKVPVAQYEEEEIAPVPLVQAVAPVANVGLSVPSLTANSDSPRIRLSPTINKYLGLDDRAEITFNDVMLQVRRWPGVSGCVITGKDGLPISAVVDDMAFSKSLSAFAPKIVSRVSELFVDLGMPEVQELHVPMDDVSTFLFREADVYFILLYKDASIPDWYRKVIKAVLEEIVSRHG